MAREIEEPKVTVGGIHDDDKVSTHPAFAQISVTRSSGGHSSLYGSDFDHHARLTLRICASELHRGLATDWFHERGQYIEVDLSEAQWATFVSTPNVGSGVPCTLTRLGGKSIPGLPAPETRTAQFGGELKAAIDKAKTALDEAAAFAGTLGLSKSKTAELQDRISAGGRKLRDIAPFLANRFDEHMEETVEKAKSEVHGYMTGQIMRAGLTALGGDASAIVPLSLPSAKASLND